MQSFPPWLPMLALVFWLSGSARADERMLVVPVTRDHQELGPLAHAVEDVTGVLGELGTPALPAGAESFEARVSHPAIPSTRQEVELLASERQLAERAVAFNDFAEAVRHARLGLRAVEASLESANRSDEVAREYLRVCAIEVRALAANGEDKAARRAVQRCKAAVPDIVPQLANTPPFVIKLFEEAAEDPSHLELRVAADKDGCRVYQSGRDLGTTATSSIVGPPGQEVRIQVQCRGERASRVHRVTLSEEVRKLEIDTSFDSAVQTSEGLLRLQYEQLDEPRVHSDALALARELGAAGAIVVSYRTPRVIWIEYVTDHSGPPPGRPLSIPYSEASLRTALNEVLALRADSAPPQALSLQKRASSEHSTRWQRAQLGIGATLVAASAITLVLTTTHFSHYRDKALALRSRPSESPNEFTDRSQAWSDARSTPLLLGAVTSGLGAVGAGFLAHAMPRAAYPWLASLSATAAGALLIVGGIQVAGGEPCKAPPSMQGVARCTNGQERRDRGALYLLGSVPFLTFSAVQFAYGRHTTELSVAAAPRHVGLHLRF
jgi:hypothetical protein